jgi:urease accessory protein
MREAGVRTAAIAQDTAGVFAANRARGRIALSVAAARGRTRRVRVHEDGSLRVRFPNAASGALEAVMVNTAGGIAGGDRFAVEIALGARADMVAGTAAAEKVYRSLGSDSEIGVKIEIGAQARLAWLPQETILFDRARLARRIEADLAGDASLLMCESVVFGRSAMGETVASGSLTDRWRVRRGGRLIFAETMRLDGAIDGRLAEPAVANGAAAIATLLVVPGEESMAAKIRDLNAKYAGEVGVSAWNGMAVARFCARDGAALRHDLISVLAALRLGELPRLWLS